MRDIVIIEFPSNLGLKEPSPGIEPGVRKLPAWLRKNRFHDFIKPAEQLSLTPPPYSMQMDPEAGVRNAAAIAGYAIEQAMLLKKVISKRQLPIVIGGDCSILIGAALALKELGNYALFYLDGHTDFMRPTLSQTGGVAGMDLAIVAGCGHDKLTDIHHQKPYISEEHIWCVGNREYDEDYVAEIRSSAIHYVDLKALRRDGIQPCVDSFLQMVEANKLEGFWVHIDVDVLNPEIMPAVDSPDPGGINYKEFEDILEPLFLHEKFSGVEITILDPDLDPDAIYTTPFVKVFCDLFNGARRNSIAG